MGGGAPYLHALCSNISARQLPRGVMKSAILPRLDFAGAQHYKRVASRIASAGHLCDTANGTETSPFTHIGTVQSGCEIGPFVADEGGGTNLTGTPATVGTKPNPSIYQFEWTGGNLTIEELLGNNGSGRIGVQVGLASNGLSSNNITLSSPLASVALTGNPSSAPSYVINNMNLAAGTYLLDNYLESSIDPNYAVLFAPVSSTPLPAALPLFAGGLGALGLLGWRRKRKAVTA
jgi:hypothetical protein